MSTYSYTNQIVKTSSTLIDNIFTNVMELKETNINTGLLISDVSDHFPIFCLQKHTRYNQLKKQMQ